MQRYTTEANRAMLFGQEEARRLNKGIFDTEHMLMGILRDRESAACQTLLALGIDPEALYRAVSDQADRTEVERSEDQYLTDGARAARQAAYDVANMLQAGEIHTGHLLAGLLRQTDTLAARALRDAGVTEESFLERVVPPQKPGFWARLFGRKRM